tara:strand:+ start:1128 stop:1823 length:696 start_codon:yes stop_codon:yes gene_type:complete
MSSGKRHNNNLENVNRDIEYSLDEAFDIMKKFKTTKFDESVDLAVNLGVDPKHADQLVRGTVSLPNGTGKEVKVIVMAKDEEKVKEATEAGADYAGFDEFFDKIKNGWFDFDVLVATPDMMAEVGKLGKVLGPRKLMPSPKAGTVTNEISKAVSEIKAGKVEFRVDKFGIIHVSIGKASFENDKLAENTKVCMDAILKAKPSSVKGTYFKKLTVSSTMSPGIKIDKNDFIK